MKAKALRFKDTKEYVAIQFFGKEAIVGSCDLPTIQPMTATISGMKNIYFNEGVENQIDFDNMEFVELDIIEAGEVGADIRNKLSPCLNLAELVKVFLNEEHPDKKNGIKELIWDVLEESKKSVDYIANLL